MFDLRRVIFDKLQSRKSQAGTQVQISDLEFSLETHFPTIHPPTPRESLHEICKGQVTKQKLFIYISRYQKWIL